MDSLHNDLDGNSILIVDDNSIDAAFMAQIMRLHGHHAVVRGSLGEALHELETSEYCVVILDLRLHDAQDVEAIRAIRQRYPELPIVVVTGMDKEYHDIGRRALEAGAQDYIIKASMSAEALMHAALKAMITHRVALRCRSYDAAMDRIGEKLSR